MSDAVTVVIPVHDRADLLRPALASVAAQRLRPDRVIVVDDGSEDGSAAVAAELGAEVAHQEQAGVSAARNRGLRLARTSRVAFLDSDDEWLPDHLSTIARVRPGFALVSTGAVTTSGRLVGSQRLRPLRLHGADRLVWPDNPVVTSATVVDRTAALDAGGFDAGIAHSEDLDLWARMLTGGTGVVLPDVTVRYREHPGQASAAVEAMLEGTGRLLEQERITPATAERTAVRDAWDRVRSEGGSLPMHLALRSPLVLGHLLAHRAVGRLVSRRLLPA